MIRYRIKVLQVILNRNIAPNLKRQFPIKTYFDAIQTCCLHLKISGPTEWKIRPFFAFISTYRPFFESLEATVFQQNTLL